MASLTDLFNPTFLMFLGILVLVVALLVVYFETKFRDQNHKISSMLSLVSSLAEELNGTKMIVQHLSMRPVSNSQNFQQQQPNLEESFVSNNKLISVSDDEDSDSDSDLESNSTESMEILDDEDNESVEEIDDNSSVNSKNSVIELGDNNDIKVLKLNINHNNNDDESSSSSEENNLDFDDLDDLDNLDDLDDLHELDESYNLEKLDDLTKRDIQIMETKEDDVQQSDIKTMDLKSININLEETKNESMDYKKMSLPKLRSIVTEKGLSTDATKLKKNELLKLIGIE